MSILLIEGLNHYEENPRYITEENFEKLKTSIMKDPEFLKARPVLVSKRKDGSLWVLGGNMKTRAAKALGMDKIPCFIFEGLSSKEEKDIVIKDNSHFGNWDYGMLANQFDIQSLDLYNISIPDIEIEIPELGEPFPEEDPPEAAGGSQSDTKSLIIQISKDRYKVAKDAYKRLREEGKNAGEILIEAFLNA